MVEIITEYPLSENPSSPLSEKTAGRIIGAISEGNQTCEEIADYISRSPNTVYRYLPDLRKRGLIEKVPTWIDDYLEERKPKLPNWFKKENKDEGKSKGGRPPIKHRLSHLPDDVDHMILDILKSVPERCSSWKPGRIIKGNAHLFWRALKGEYDIKDIIHI